jgi:hypothetical protein
VPDLKTIEYLAERREETNLNRLSVEGNSCLSNGDGEISVEEFQLKAEGLPGLAPELQSRNLSSLFG